MSQSNPHSWGNTMNGADLRALRQSAEMSRTDLARLCGLSPYTVRYWERQAVVRTCGHAPRRMLAALGRADLIERQRSDRLGGFSRHLHAGASWGQPAKSRPVALKVPKRLRPMCGARTRTGHPCQARAVPGRTRCRMHGGASVKKSLESILRPQSH